MATRIEFSEDTEQLLGRILHVILTEGNRALFLCDAGSGDRVNARLRVMLSRKRAKLSRHGKRTKQFALCHSIHSETHGGKRYDAIVMWRRTGIKDIMKESLEDLLSNG